MCSATSYDPGSIVGRLLLNTSSHEIVFQPSNATRLLKVQEWGSEGELGAAMSTDIYKMKKTQVIKPGFSILGGITNHALCEEPD